MIAVRARRPWAIVALVVVAVAIVYVGVQLRRQAAAARLPQLPDLAAETKAVGDHLRERDAAARVDPSSATPSVRSALRTTPTWSTTRRNDATRWSEALDPSGWQWPYYRALAESTRGSGDALAAGMRRVDRARS